ncbi:MAG: LysM peptidoglycan-binding domain-containing protein [Deltaproteobacteria bacterium]|nr:LysM peptidoglycan-binding domain-containing protein [Deltaproteobacteria bacterium]
MGASAAKAARKDKNSDHGHEHEGEAAHFDGSYADGIDALAQQIAVDEAKKGDDAGDKKAEAQPTPESKPKQAAVAPEAGKTVDLGGGTWTVGKGDSLWSIADHTYGKGTYWNELKKANKSKVHGAQNIILDGEVLTLPTLAVSTLTALKNFEDQPELMRDLVVGMSEEEYRGFLQNTPRATLEKHGQLLMDVEAMRSTGMTMDELAQEQKEFIEQEAKKAGKSPGQYVKDLVATEGYGGGEATMWNKLDKGQKKKWEDRFKAAVKSIKETAPPDVKEIIKDAEGKGGGFRWNPAETEKNTAFAYTSDDWALHCGTRWVEAAETDTASVYGNITHEMGGHNYYGATNGWKIQEKAIDQLDGKEKEKATSGGNSSWSAYGYMETEIFAELYEFTYATKGNPTDTPFEVDAKGQDLTGERKRKTRSGKEFLVGDVSYQLKRIKAAFAPKVAEAVVRGLWRRVQVDPRILDKAKELFATDVKGVLGIDLA